MRFTRWALRLTVVFLVLAAPLALLAVFDPASTWWYPSCPFHALTGWLCPLCGSLRAVHALLHGSPSAAFAFNPLTTMAAPAWLASRRRVTAFCFSASGAALLGAFALLRNLPLHFVWPGH
jgi:uncharacterized protein DUF2752